MRMNKITTSATAAAKKKLIWFILHPRKWWFYEKWNSTTALIQLIQCNENKFTFKLCCQTSIMILQIFNVYSQVINNVITSLHIYTIFIVLAPKAFILFSSFFVYALWCIKRSLLFVVTLYKELELIRMCFGFTISP